MLIRTLTRAAGHLSFRPGDVLQVSDSLGRTLIAVGSAEDITPFAEAPVPAAVAPITQVIAPPQVKRKRRKPR